MNSCELNGAATEKMEWKHVEAVREFTTEGQCSKMKVGNPRVELTLSELQEMATRQQQQIEAQQQMLVAKEQRLRYLKQQERRQQQSISESEKLQKLKERVENQEAKLKKIRAMRGQVDYSKVMNGNLSAEVEHINAMFQEKQLELQSAVLKVDQLSQQLEDLRKGKLSGFQSFNGQVTGAAALELKKLYQELQIRNKLNQEQNSKLQHQKEALNKRNMEVSMMDKRVNELRDRLYKKKAEARQKENIPLNRINGIPSPQPVPAHSGRVAAVGPYIQVPAPGRPEGSYHIPGDPVKPQSLTVSGSTSHARSKSETDGRWLKKSPGTWKVSDLDIIVDPVLSTPTPSLQSPDHRYTHMASSSLSDTLSSNDANWPTLNKQGSLSTMKGSHVDWKESSMDTALKAGQSPPVPSTQASEKFVHLVHSSVVYGKPVLAPSSAPPSPLPFLQGPPYPSPQPPSQEDGADQEIELENPPPPPPGEGNHSVDSIHRPLSPTKLTPIVHSPLRYQSDADLEFLRKKLANAPRPLKKRSSITEPEGPSGPNIQKLLYQRFNTLAGGMESTGTPFYQPTTTPDYMGGVLADVDNGNLPEPTAVILPPASQLPSPSPEPQLPSSDTNDNELLSPPTEELITDDANQPAGTTEDSNNNPATVPEQLPSPIPEVSSPEEADDLPPPLGPPPQPPVKRTNLKKPNSERTGHGLRVKFNPLALLLDASLEGEFDLVQRIIYEVENPSTPNDEGITPLHNAVCAGHHHIVKFLLDFGVNVNAADSDGWTPLHCAASCNSVHLCKLLVESGAAIFASTISDVETAADKCEEMEEGYIQCSQFLYGVQEKLGVMNKGTVYALWQYEAQNNDELSFREGDAITILRRKDDSETEWWWGRLNDKEGYVPRNLLGLLSPPTEELITDDANQPAGTTEDSNNNPATVPEQLPSPIPEVSSPEEADDLPPPPGPPPQPPVKRTNLKKPNSERTGHGLRVKFNPLALLLDASLEGEFDLVQRIIYELLCSSQVENPSTPNDEGVQEKLGVMNKGTVYALWQYEAQNNDELSFREGDAITILRRKDDKKTGRPKTVRKKD
ncbi:UNVERIFIED_CONTAM: hypothetical protein FKN15_072273 [Acipenser sinensis]